MKHALPELPYSFDALEPYISKETLDYHYNKHHAAYVEKLNKQVVGSEFTDMELEKIIKHTEPGGNIFNNAAQVWNHTFYWQSMTPDSPGEPNGKLAERINTTFGDLEKFQKAFINVAKGKFGSGWVWLVRKDDGAIDIFATSNADTVIRFQQKPLFVCDVWEHAYYIDYRNKRGEYLDGFFQLIDWDFAEKNFVKTK